jgi:hypothetical protein
MNHRGPVNLHDDDLNLVLMVVMKVCRNQDVPDDQMNLQSLDVKKVDPMMGDRWMDGQKMDVRNYLVDLNFRDVLPCAYSLISIEI